MLIAMILAYFRLRGRLSLPGIVMMMPLLVFPMNCCVNAQQSPDALPGIDNTPAVMEGFTRFEATPAKASKKLPKDLRETSALIWFRGAWWTLNDSGGKPEVYRLSKSGNRIEQVVALSGVENNDWEDLATDGTWLYVGDFGNNGGKRTNLAVYKVAWINIPNEGNVTLKPQVIRFAWADQTDLHPKAYRHNFDCEAMFCAGGSVWLWTKNWNNLNSRLYELPAQAGSYNLKPVYEFDANLRVTGADYDTNRRILALVGYIDFLPSVWLFTNFDPKKPADGGRIRIDMTSMAGTQAEGICFGDNGQLWFSAEKTKVRPQMIYQLNVNTFVRPNL